MVTRVQNLILHGVKFIKEINSSQSYYESVKKFNIPSVVKEFMDFTFDIIKTNKNHVIASVFTFGREDLIPDMFIEIVKKLSSEKNLFDGRYMEKIPWPW